MTQEELIYRLRNRLGDDAESASDELLADYLEEAHTAIFSKVQVKYESQPNNLMRDEPSMHLPIAYQFDVDF